MLLRSWIRWKRPGCACDRFDHVGTEIGALSIAIESRRSCWFRFRVVICARDSVPRTNAPRCSRAMAVPGTPRAWGSSARRAERSESRHAKLETAPNRSLRGRAQARVPSTTLKGSAGWPEGGAARAEGLDRFPRGARARAAAHLRTSQPTRRAPRCTTATPARSRWSRWRHHDIVFVTARNA